jgi:hypothetical protein
MSWKNFYVYQYLNEDGTPFYIGKGSKNRINESHAPWINLPPIDRRIVIRDNLTENEAFDLELELIKKFGRKIDGGILENIKITRWVAQSGWNHSEETKKKISEKNTGKIRTKEHIENYKKPKSKEHIEKNRQANLGRISDKTRNFKIKESMKIKRWYTDGKNSVFCEPGNQPKNYSPGRILRRKNHVMA